MASREAQLEKLSEEDPFDMIIIGGGASGLGIALDSASRGFRVALFEQYDFAKGTSGKSTKLLHGGVRYLAQGNIKLVTEALEERGLLAKNARHLFKSQEFIIPNYNWWGGYYYALGLKLYDFLSRKLSLGRSRRISGKKVKKLLPTLLSTNLHSGVSYFDGQFDDARLALNIAQTAVEHGAVILNYMKVNSLIKEGDNVQGVEVTDSLSEKTYKVKGRVVINATGIFTDKILKMQDPTHKKTVVPSQGVHLVLDHSFLESDKAIMVPKTSDGRVLFIIPWHDKVIAGTTDTLIKKPKIEPVAQDSEIDFILDTVNAHLTKKAGRDDVLSVFSGLRPLAKPRGDSVKTKEFSRSHKIYGSNNLVSIVGGKWTTYRKMSEDAVDYVLEHCDFERIPCKTRDISIHGNLEEGIPVRDDHLYIYGSEVDEFLGFQGSNPGYKELIHPDYPYTKGQVIWSVRHEMAQNIEDFLSRRIRLTLLDTRAAISAAPEVAAIMAKELGKNAAWEAEQVSEFRELAEKYIIHKRGL